MNKIYADPIAKSKALAQGVKENETILNGLVSQASVAQLEAACSALEQAGAEQDAAMEKLNAARKKAHDLLDELKGLYASAKDPIKTRFPMEQWSQFGIADKR